MKKFILSAGMLISTLAYSQVGINNQDPKSTLDVTAKTTDGSKAEGFIAPRLTGDALSTAETGAKYGAAQNGTIVYVTAAATTPGTGQTQNITSVGYYYFDATVNKWKSLTQASSGGTSGSGDSYKNFNNNTCHAMGSNCLYTAPAGTFASDEGKTIVFANAIFANNRLSIPVDALPAHNAGVTKVIKFLIFIQESSTTNTELMIVGKVMGIVATPNGWKEYTCVSNGSTWSVYTSGVLAQQ